MPEQTLWSQAGYLHPTRNRFELTAGGRTQVLAQPVPYPALTWSYAPSATATTGLTQGQVYLPARGDRRRARAAKRAAEAEEKEDVEVAEEEMKDLQRRLRRLEQAIERSRRDR